MIEPCKASGRCLVLCYTGLTYIGVNVEKGYNHNTKAGSV